MRLPRGALAWLRDADPALASVIDRVGRFAMRHARASSELEALARSIIWQQLSGKAASTIFGRFCALFDGSGFPSAEAILATHPARLKKAGVSRQKQAALEDLCRHVVSGRLPLGHLATLDDEALVQRLVEVRGIGRWSAQMFMMFHLGRLDVWPEDDLGIRKGVARLRGLDALPDRKTMRALGERYRPYCTVASWYLWRSLDAEAQI